MDPPTGVFTRRRLPAAGAAGAHGSSSLRSDGLPACLPRARPSGSQLDPRGGYLPPRLLFAFTTARLGMRYPLLNIQAKGERRAYARLLYCWSRWGYTAGTAHWVSASSLVDICHRILCDVAGGCSADRAVVTFLLSGCGGNLRCAGQHECAPALPLAAC